MKLTNMFFGIITTTAILTTGCSSLTMQQYDGLHTNQTFVLQKPLTIAAGSTRVFIQQGRSMSGSGFNRSEQHCRLEVKKLSDQQQTIQADKFQITAIQIDEEMIASNHLPALQLAFNSYTATQYDYTTPVNHTLADSSQERVETMDLVHLNLLSKSQNNVMRLTCAGALSNGDMADAPRSYRPNLTQINHILGEIGYIRN